MIEAIQFFQEALLDDVFEFAKPHFRCKTTADGKFVAWIKTMEGDLIVSDKDWIIKGIKGEFYPCKPDIFEATYDEVIE